MDLPNPRRSQQPQLLLLLPIGFDFWLTFLLMPPLFRVSLVPVHLRLSGAAAEVLKAALPVDRWVVQAMPLAEARESQLCLVLAPDHSPPASVWENPEEQFQSQPLRDQPVAPHRDGCRDLKIVRRDAL
jgi:hypothetical protein